MTQGHWSSLEGFDLHDPRTESAENLQIHGGLQREASASCRDDHLRSAVLSAHSRFPRDTPVLSSKLGHCGQTQDA